jgi:protein-S-isoprenylcysteine O-methyltransferase Ste14
MLTERPPMNQPKVLFRGAIVLYFVIGLEILIMISPAAGFFYAAFNPFLLALAQTPATRWLTAFYLPHMVSPPDAFLKVLRVLGSFLFLAGAAVFLICAGQVYYKKFARKGVVLGGLYRWIRHPQYLGLAMTGMGLSILWPRLLTVALWAVMVILYYLLARDEERRMVGQFGDDYRHYMDRSGMFLPKGLEAVSQKLVPLGNPSLRAALMFVLVAVCSVGGAFALRSYTVKSLPLWSNGPVTTLAILPNDMMMLEHRMGAVLELPEIQARLAKQPGPFLVYVMPKDYVMQGMIADTGHEWQLYKRHHTLAMISDWVFHPFRHLENGHAAMHHDMSGATGMHASDNGMDRRMIFLRVETQGGDATPAHLFAIKSKRSPLFVADVDVHNGIVQDLRDLPAETGWGRVPTPIF